MVAFPLRSCFLILVASSAAAQTPVFTPPAPSPGPVAAPEKPAPPGTGAKKEPAPAPPASQEDPVGALVARLNRWPAPKAKEAMMILAGLGAQAKGRLLEGLADNDWRIQAGCASALAEMGEKDAIPPLKLAIADPSNRAGLPELMKALVRIDAEAGTAMVLPFIGHQSGRVRQAARDALPDVIAASYLPRVAELVKNPRGPVRASALELLARVEGGPEREEWYTSLSDPEPQVAWTAARHLGRRQEGPVRERLLRVAETSPMRPAAYAMLALVVDEDAHGAGTVPDAGAVRNRAQTYLRGEDPFYRGAAAILLANLSFRSEDAVLRRLADQYLVPILVTTVAGGVYFSDYGSLEDLCWRKLELLTGRGFGQDARAWKEWWAGAESGFTARRELRGIQASEIARCRLLVSRMDADGRTHDILLTGDVNDSAAEGPAPLVLSAEHREGLAAALKACRFFETRGEPEEAVRSGPSLRIVLLVPGAALQFRRYHRGPVPEELRPLVDLADTWRQELAWQRFVPGASAAERARALAAEQERFATLSPADRQERILALALEAYPAAAPPVRRLAIEVFTGAPADWRRACRAALCRLLGHEQRLTDEAGDLIALLSEDPDPEFRRTVLDLAVSAPEARGIEVLRAYLARQPMPSVEAMFTDTRARVRAAAAESLARFRDDDQVLGLLISGLNDAEAPVRAACLRSLAVMPDDRVSALLESVLKSEDAALRHRAIQALGVVGRDQAVPRLMDLWREGDRHQKWAVIRGLREAGGKRALTAMTSIVRESGDIDLRREALVVLIGIGGPDAAADLQEIIGKVAEAELKSLAVAGLPRVMGREAAPVLVPLLEAENPEVRRVTVLTLARLGAIESLSHLHRMLHASVEGDSAAERALEELTFHCPSNPSPPRRLEEHLLWAQRHGAEDRSAWLYLAAREAGTPLDESADWFEAGSMETADLHALVTLLEKGNRALRIFADARLRALLAKDLEPIPTLSAPAEVAERAAFFKSRLAGR